ncbi:MAG: hypothetical protein JO115_20600 [Pseudonocardiales bacterium]|nr:hypothetical protein [Pseudonocardiales bacterium]
MSISTITDLAAAPELAAEMDELMSSNLPAFMMWESPGNWRWSSGYRLFPEHHLIAVDGAGRVIAAANGVPLCWAGPYAKLPLGYDDVLMQAVDGAPRRSDGPNWATCLLSISVHRDYRGGSIPERLLTESLRRAKDRDHPGIIIPLRPTKKPDYPLIPIEEYAAWQKPGSVDPFDPWLRTHVRAGGRVLGFAKRSLVIRQPVQRWSELLGTPLPGPGRYVVPGALVPIEVDINRFGTYVEPNIWVWHSIERLANPEHKNDNHLSTSIGGEHD